MGKRLFDLVASGVGIVLLAPLMLAIAVAIKLESTGPVFFRQDRVGRFGVVFSIHKFRTMVSSADFTELQLTVGSDRRVTRVGAALRRFKLDELAQLIDVLVGDMSLVGPRPEVPRYVEHYPSDCREIILSVRPGITDWASIYFRDESEMLGRAADPELAYINQVLPIKTAYYVEYVRTASFVGDVRIIAATLGAIFR